MFNLQGTLLAASSTHSHPWLTMGGSNRAVAVPKCLSWSGFPCGEQLFLILSSVSSHGMGGGSDSAVDWLSVLTLVTCPGRAPPVPAAGTLLVMESSSMRCYRDALS